MNKKVIRRVSGVDAYLEYEYGYYDLQDRDALGSLHFIRHREDGPAVKTISGNYLWYINDQLHRDNGPAIVFKTGLKEWYKNGVRHREDGPAVHEEYNHAWYFNGRHIDVSSQEEFEKTIKYLNF
jgi:hypothetical protein